MMVTTDRPRITFNTPLHEGQRAVVNHPARFQVLCCGRRWGKTKLGSLLCVVNATKGQHTWWVGPSYQTAKIGWREIKRLSLQIPGAEIRESDRQVSFPGGGWVMVRSADNPDSLRGEGLDFVVIDECAIVHPDAWGEALRPTLADRKGRALFISTPKGRNWFWHLWQRGNNGDDPEWKSWQFPTLSNPFIDPAEIEQSRLDMSDREFREEFLAEFIEDGAGVFRRVSDAATALPLPRGEPNRQYVYGVDWGKSNDFTVITVLDAATRTQVAFDRFNQIDYQIQLGRLQALTARFKPAALIVESNSMGGPLIEQLQRAPYRLPVQPFTTTNSTKSEIIDGLALALERGDISILNEPTLIAELQAYESERLPSGLLRYGAPAGMHDDTVMSLALALYGIDYYRSRQVLSW